MKKMFCPNCGKKHEFNHAPPNFCSGCGNPLTSTARKAPSSSPSKEDEELDEGETDVSEVPYLDNFEVEVDQIRSHGGATLGDVLMKPTPPDFTPKPREDLGDFLDAKK